MTRRFPQPPSPTTTLTGAHVPALVGRDYLVIWPTSADQIQYFRAGDATTTAPAARSPSTGTTWNATDGQIEQTTDGTSASFAVPDDLLGTDLLSHGPYTVIWIGTLNNATGGPGDFPMTIRQLSGSFYGFEFYVSGGGRVYLGSVLASGDARLNCEFIPSSSAERILVHRHESGAQKSVVGWVSDRTGTASTPTGAVIADAGEPIRVGYTWKSGANHVHWKGAILVPEALDDDEIDDIVGASGLLVSTDNSAAGGGVLPVGVTAPEFVAAPKRGQVAVAEVTVCTDSLGSLRTHYFSSGLGWVTAPSDTPPSTYIAPGLVNAGGYQRSMFAGSALFGAMQASFGSIEISNADGKLDSWVDYAFDGRPITLWIGQEGEAFPSGFTRVVTTDLLAATISPTKATLRLRDPMHLLERPIVRERFTGAGGLEGPPSLAGQPKPRCAGGTHFTPMVLVDEANWIYLVCTDATLPIGSTVHVGGVAVTQGAAYASTADLVATAPTLGETRVYFGGPTYVRFAAEPAGEPTITRLAGIGSGAVMATLAAEAGLITHGTHITGPVMGAYVDDNRTSYLDVFAREALQTPKWFGLDRQGLFVVRDVTDPAGGTSLALITAHEKLQISRATPNGLDVPLWRVTARGDRNWSRDRTLAAGAIAAARQDYGNSSSASDASVLTRHPLAGELALEIGNDPGVTASSHLALHGTDRFVWRVTVDLVPEWVSIDLGDVVTLQHHRLQLAAGKKLLVVGVDIDLASQRLAFNLWG